MTTNPITGQTDVMDPVARVLLSQAMRDRQMSHWLDPIGRLAQFGVGAFIEEGRRKGEESEMKDWLGAMPGLGTPGASPAAATPGPTGPRPQPMDAAAPASTGRPEQPAWTAPGIPGVLPGAQAPAAATAAAPQAGDTGRMLEVLAAKESGGKYDALGPTVTYKSGQQDRAYGKYQIMGANIPQWTQEHLGRPMTPEEFLRNPEAQEKVAQGQFTKYLKQTGSVDDAVAMWASGRPLAQSANDRDLAFGTKVADYVADYKKRLGGQQVAQAPAPAAPTATPSMTDVTRQPGTIPPEVAAHIKKGLDSRNPRVRAAALGLYQQYATPEKTTDEMREYAFSARQHQAAGRPVPSFDEWKKSVKSPLVTIDQSVGKGQAANDVETVKELATEARASAGELRVIPQLRAALQKIGKTGALAQTEMKVGQWEQALGITIVGVDKDRVANMETIGTLVGDMVNERVKNFKPVTVDERNWVQGTLPQLQKTPGGNMLILEFLEKAARERVRDHYDAYRELNGPDKSLSKYYERRAKRLGIVDETGATPPPTPTSPAPKAAAPHTMQSITLPDGSKIRGYHDGRRWFKEDGTPLQ